MVKKIHSKTETKIEADSFEIVACKNKDLQSFLNVFHFEGETFAQTGLGKVFGVIQVHDHSEQSAYLPNLIAQVIKKEFYKNSKRATEESFEAALHKANSALAELAQHELVSWHGKLHAVIGAVNSDHFLFTQANGGKIFLIRDKKISEISNELDEPTDNPIKTFSNVSEGTIENGDKVIFSTESIHDSLTMDDLKRHANTFSPDELDNLLKSTIESEGENVGTIVVNFSEKTIPQAPREKGKRFASVNYFGNDEKQSDAKIEKKQTSEAKKEHKKQQSRTKEDKISVREEDENDHGGEPEDKQPDDGKNMSPFEKQPELFIKEDGQTEKADDSDDKKISLDSFGNRPDEIFNKIKKALSFSKVKNASLAIKKKTAELGVEKSKKVLEKAKNITQKTIKPKIKVERDEELSTEIPPIEKKETIKEVSSANIPDFHESTKINVKASGEKDETGTKLAKFWEKNEQPVITTNQDEPEQALPKRRLLLKSAGKIMQKVRMLSSKISPHDSDNLNKKKPSVKLLGILAIAIVIIGGISLLFVANKNSNEPPEQNQPIDVNDETQKNDPVSLKGENINIEKLADLESDVVAMTFDDGEVFMLTSLNSFYRYDTHNGTLDEISIEDQLRSAEAIDVIDSLNVIILVSSKESVSYLRVTKSFDENKIDLPEDLAIIGTGSYLSYFYIFDKTSGQIYRYSRTIEKPEVWLKNPLDATGATDMAIDDSIRIGYSDGRIERYFKGKQESSFLLDADPKIIPHKIATTTDHEFYYILDKEQGIIAKIGKNNDQVQETYKDEKISGAKDIYLDVSANSIYFVSKSAELMKLGLN